ncbi:MAG: ATP-dependent DNA helicase UvrD2 [Ancrocorticia sp.]|nr:ATP-dependent DNA helicase UvrD2 [Ancrocorticia sp.]
MIAADRSEGAVSLSSQLPSSVPVQWKEYPDDEGEASGIVGEILTLKEQGIPLQDMAILYRTNAQSAQFEAALAQAGVGYSVRGSERFFSRREVREAMVAMRAAARSGAEGDLPNVVRTVLRQMGWRDEAPDQAGAARERWDALNALLSLAKEMQAKRGAGITEFVQELEERALMQNAPEMDGVTLSSLHAAKGLEWEAVFLAGMSEGLMPISLAKGKEGTAEERRLLYVGITRAKQHLQVSYAKGNGSRANRKVTRFLDGIWPAPEKKVSRTTDYRRRKAQARTDFTRDHPEDVELLERLVQWRSAKATQLERPAYTVFHDTTLRAIAIAKPAGIQQLGRIKGIGSTKLEAWGEEVLDIVNG